MTRDWLTITTIDHAITGYLCLIVGFTIGMHLGQHLTSEGLLAIAGGAAGAMVAVVGAIHVEIRFRRGDRKEDRAALVEAARNALAETTTVLKECEAAKNVFQHIEAAERLSVVAARTASLTEQALLHAKTINMRERVILSRVDATNRTYIQQFDQSIATLHEIQVKMPATTEHHKAMDQAGNMTSFAAKLRDMADILVDELERRKVDA